jgi:hypothetical protein
LEFSRGDTVNEWCEKPKIQTPVTFKQLKWDSKVPESDFRPFAPPALKSDVSRSRPNSASRRVDDKQAGNEERQPQLLRLVFLTGKWRRVNPWLPIDLKYNKLPYKLIKLY